MPNGTTKQTDGLATDHIGCEKCGGLGFVNVIDGPWVPCPGKTGSVVVVRHEAEPEPMELPRGMKALLRDIKRCADNDLELVLTERRVRMLADLFGVSQ